LTYGPLASATHGGEFAYYCMWFILIWILIVEPVRDWYKNQP